MQELWYVILGLVVGVLAGILGIGGAVFIIPALVYIFGWQQHMAQGTTLAMLIPPIGILAAIKYYQAGHVDIKVAGLMCVGFLVGGYFGGSIATQLPDVMLKRIFGGALFLIAAQMMFGK